MRDAPGAQAGNAAPQAVSQVDSALSELHAEQHELGNVILDLQKRLAPVLSAPTPEPGSAIERGANVVPVAARVAERVTERTQATIVMRQQVKAIIARLEV